MHGVREEAPRILPERARRTGGGRRARGHFESGGLSGSIPRVGCCFFSSFFCLISFFTLSAGTAAHESNFSLKCCAFQTIRPVISRKKCGFSTHFGPDVAVLPPRVFTFFKGETPYRFFLQGEFFS
ncbi:MAG: hypothetical protein MSH25_10425 [Desulfovibrio sp.]|uniref:hypothetical protein n=1 Tax=Desulfovibrio sp. TaxID=885 RepID=UPI0025C6DCA4|nr:hypothetical protein [Desulfovibrio sp.]MCI7569755.1 hypothetical protein [Desulfovibrio sp.]